MSKVQDRSTLWRLGTRRWSVVMLLSGCSAIAAERRPGIDSGLRDPMEPAGFTAAPVAAAPSDLTPVTAYRVQAIKIDTRFRTALINDRLVTEGTLLGDARVLKIHAAEVVIEQNEKRTHLKLNPHAIKHPVQASR